MLKFSLSDQKTGRPIAAANSYSAEQVLVTTSYGAENGVFKAVTNSGVQTQTIVTPASDDSIVITDIILTSTKVNNSTTVVRFYDGTNTANIIVGDSSNAPITMAISFAGKWHGWRGARLELVTDTILQAATVAVGYFKVEAGKSLSYSDWNARR